MLEAMSQYPSPSNETALYIAVSEFLLSGHGDSREEKRGKAI